MAEMSLSEDPVKVPVEAADRRIALSDLYRQEYRSLVRLAALLLDRNDLAEEVVQEAFIRMDQSWERVRDPGARPAYLRSIVLNLTRSRMRRRLVAGRRSQLHAVDAAAAEERAVLREDQREVIEALKGLPSRQRACLVLRYWQDLTESEIADSLGISQGSVKSHLHRGMRAMTMKLEALA